MEAVERNEPVAHRDRCRDLLQIMKDPVCRRTIADLITCLDAKLAKIDGRKERP